MLYGLLTSNRPPGTWAWRGTNALVVGKVLDAAVSAGSNTIQEVSFDLKDAQPQKDLALTLAIEDASRKAEVAAKAAGVKLGRVLEVSEGYGYVAAKSQS